MIYCWTSIKLEGLRRGENTVQLETGQKYPDFQLTVWAKLQKTLQLPYCNSTASFTRHNRRHDAVFTDERCLQYARGACQVTAPPTHTHTHFWWQRLRKLHLTFVFSVWQVCRGEREQSLSLKISVSFTPHTPVLCLEVCTVISTAWLQMFEATPLCWIDWFCVKEVSISGYYIHLLGCLPKWSDDTSYKACFQHSHTLFSILCENVF